MSSASAPPTDPANAPAPEYSNGQPQTKRASPAFLHSPPDSNNAHKSDATDSELSDLDEEPVLPDTGADEDQTRHSSPPLRSSQEPEKAESPCKNELGEETQDEDIGEILPDHWSGAVAVFKPTMHQFKDFKRFMDKVNSYGMKSGIIKIIPPPEWKEKQPPLDDLVKGVRVREPIKQDIMGSNGTYRQVNILHGRSYNVPQWRQLCDASEHQPPARRGERRANVDKPKPQRRPAAPKPADPSTPKKRGKKASRKRGRPGQKAADEDRPMTPVSPKPEEKDPENGGGDVINTVENDADADADAPAGPRRMGAVQPAKTKTQSVSARRKYSKREGSAMIDEAAFKDFDYQMDISDYTPERCEELERAYWKTLTYAPPLYGADMMGTLFDDRTETWNLNKLPNLLDVLGTKIPGVNTAYLYFGMWKATFAWHLEDVDLYSINYVHFGAPKQWYSISQADARRFESAMKSIWPADAKACSQFLRHKGYLISPQHLLQNYGIKVNKVVSYPGEFVVTFPYGYHSGYNLGYNCAEAVNFALEPWLEMGKIAKRCECAQAQDSVWINVYEIERKLRGEETEYEETEDEEEDEEEDEDDNSGLPSPPPSHGVKIKVASRKRKRGRNEKLPRVKVKKIKLRLKTRAEPPCALCPNEIPTMELLHTDDGRKAHRVCALYLPETYIDEVDGKEVVSNIAGVHKDRTELKCLYCRSKRGACFQCSHHKCTRAYHATCAAAAGVFIEEGEVPVYGEDQTEYKEQAFEFSCRFHRAKREKKLDGDALEDDMRIQEAARKLEKGAVCQFQYRKGDIFAGVVVENRSDEQTLLIDILPHGERFEVEWKWLLLPDPSDYHLPKASPNAIPLPSSRKAKDKLNTKRSTDDKPRKDDPFTEGTTWAEFNLHEVERNKDQVNVDLFKADQVWHYLPKLSTDARDKYTEDPAKKVHNFKSQFLATVPKPIKLKPAPKPASVSKQVPPPQFYQPSAVSYPTKFSSIGAASTTWTASRTEKPYVYKPRKPVEPSFDESRMFTQQRFSVSQPQPPANNYQAQQHHASQNLPRHPPQPQSDQRPAYNSHTKQGNVYQSGSPQANHAQGSISTLPAQHAVPSRHVQPVQNAQHTSSSVASANGNARQVQKPSWQIHSQIYQKYPFFQVHHNRDSSKYRTPYAPSGGFTNGYEGDLRAHLLANSKELLRRSSLGSRPHSGSGYPSSASSIHSAPRSGLPATSPATPSTPQGITIGFPTGHAQSPPLTSPKSNGGKSSATTTQEATGNTSAPKPKPVQAPKSYKIPAKQSPVPLPANFLAAMTASPSTVSASPQSTSPLFKKAATSAAEPQGRSEGNTPSSTFIQSNRPSVAPISIPKFTGMTPHQAAAQAGSTGLPPPMPDSVIRSVPAQESNVAIPVTKNVSVIPTETGTTEVNIVTQQTTAQPRFASENAPQEFPDVPGSESMEFMEKMMANLRRVVHS